MLKAFIGIPTTGDMHQTLLGALMDMAEQVHQVTFFKNICIEHSRNMMVKQFLEETDADYLLMMDSDNTPSRNPLELMALDKDIMICPTPMYRAANTDAGVRLSWNVLRWDGEHFQPHEDCEGLQKVDAGGTGCMMIHRRVLEGMPNPFERIFDDEGLVMYGSDLWFCKKAGDRGFETWAHFDYPCHHYKEMDLLGVMRMLAARDIAHANAPNINTPEYWDAQWSQRPERDYPYHDQIVELCRGKTSILDYGCGRGDLLAKLSKVCPNAWGADFSKKAIEIVNGRGLLGIEADTVPIGPNLSGKWSVIVATELIEHVDDDRGLIESFFQHTDHVILAVPNNCLPPGIEREHRRVYTQDYLERIVPGKCEISVVDKYLLASCRTDTG